MESKIKNHAAVLVSDGERFNKLLDGYRAAKRAVNDYLDGEQIIITRPQRDMYQEPF